MPFIERNEASEIVGVYARPQLGIAEERLQNDDPELVAFRNRPQPAPGDRVKQTIQSNATLRALAKRMANKEGIPLGQLLNEIAAEADGG